MFKELKPALLMLVVLTILTGLIYPLAVTGAAQALFPRQAAGSLVEKDGKVVGSALIGQEFKGPSYFHGRPSATTPTPYNAAASGASNLAPSATTLVEGTAARIAAAKSDNPDEAGRVPADLVTASASGLDPHISPAAAAYQVKRVATARHAPQEEIRRLILAHTEPRTLGVLGEATVNVLALNLALDERWPAP